MIDNIEEILIYVWIFIIFGAALFFTNKFVKAIFVRVVIFEYERGLRYQRGKFAGILQHGAYCFFAA